MEIIPAIMPKNFEELSEKAGLVRGLVDFVQVDIMDGKLTKHSSWPYKKTPDVYFDALKNESKGLPFWEDLDYEFDLMVVNPEEVVRDFVNSGASRIIIHVETITNWTDIIEVLKEKVEIGLAIGISTPIDILEPYINDIDFIQCMGIARIGLQGEPFDEKVLEKISQIKSLYPDKIVSVDGGVHEDSAPILIASGADRLVVGSSIFESGDVEEAIENLKSTLG
ncbi:MAG: hypothetical protein EXS50_02050 [Candidatus Taylorbacteria bacterium]|nr:hypothetical protein [Candidatus Taylorbacteria bacterium]